VDTVLKNSNYARFGEADSQDRCLELEGNRSFLFGIIPDDDLRCDQTCVALHSRTKLLHCFARIWGSFHRPLEQDNCSDQVILSRLSQR
jgi:hypothetical protein